MRKPSDPRFILAPNASPMTLDGTRTYVVGVERPVVIDPGPPDDSHIAAVRSLLNGAVPLAIFVTHSHSDHSGAAVALADATGAPIWMGRGALTPVIPVERVARWTREGDRLETDAGALTVMETPGHAPEHVSLFFAPSADESRGALFAGDLFLGSGDTTLVAHPEGNVAAYLRTLDRVRLLAPNIILPAHGPAIEDVPRRIARFRDHRIDRVRRVETIVEKHPDIDASTLLWLIYGPLLDPRLRDAALASIEAIRHYLRE